MDYPITLTGASKLDNDPFFPAGRDTKDKQEKIRICIALQCVKSTYFAKLPLNSLLFRIKSMQTVKHLLEYLRLEFLINLQEWKYRHATWKWLFCSILKGSHDIYLGRGTLGRAYCKKCGSLVF